TQASAVALAASEIKVDPYRLGIRTTSIRFRRHLTVSINPVNKISRCRECVVILVRTDSKQMDIKGNLIAVSYGLYGHMADCTRISILTSIKRCARTLGMINSSYLRESAICGKGSRIAHMAIV